MKRDRIRTTDSISLCIVRVTRGNRPVKTLVAAVNLCDPSSCLLVILHYSVLLSHPCRRSVPCSQLVLVHVFLVLWWRLLRSGQAVEGGERRGKLLVKGGGVETGETGGELKVCAKGG